MGPATTPPTRSLLNRHELHPAYRTVAGSVGDVSGMHRAVVFLPHFLPCSRPRAAVPDPAADGTSRQKRNDEEEDRAAPYAAWLAVSGWRRLGLVLPILPHCSWSLCSGSSVFLNRKTRSPSIELRTLRSATVTASKAKFTRHRRASLFEGPLAKGLPPPTCRGRNHQRALNQLRKTQ